MLSDSRIPAPGEVIHVGYAKAMGVDMRVSHWQPDGWLTAEVA